MKSSTMEWPFFDDSHRKLAESLEAWASTEIDQANDSDVDSACRSLVKQLGKGGWLKYGVPSAYGGIHDQLDVRSLCIARETLGRVSGLADFSFAMQALGSGPISLYGSDELKRKYLPQVATGDAIAAFAISEPDAGSDVAAMSTTATLDGNDYVINGTKTWISNGGIADQYVVFCKVAGTDREFVALVVEPSDKGFSADERFDMIAPHPLAKLTFNDVRVPVSRIVGEKGKGLSVALGTLDVFRSTVGAAALGFARRALDEALAHVSQRKLFGEMLKDFQLTQARIATMATDIDASALLVYRAAWTKDTQGRRVTREAAMAKMYATEAAQRVIDSAVQLLGGLGVVSGHPVEKLYREIRALRIYEGTTEVQQLIIGRNVIESFNDKARTND
ncbi:MAG: acyl-CoA dehydrogenase family protein [Gemmatimonadaceae bacterium]